MFHFFFENIINKNNKILNSQDPIYFLKAIKNKKEINNIKQAHIYDGVALTKFFILAQKKNFTKKSYRNKCVTKNYYNLEKKIKVLNLQVFQPYLEQDLMEQLFITKQQKN